MIGAVEIDAPIAAAGRAVVEVKAMGVCGSDVHGFFCFSSLSARRTK